MVTGISIFLNLLAVYLILTKSRKEIYQYRKLLIIFLTSGITFAVLHLISQPVRVRQVLVDIKPALFHRKTVVFLVSIGYSDMHHSWEHVSVVRDRLDHRYAVPMYLLWRGVLELSHSSYALYLQSDGYFKVRETMETHHNKSVISSKSHNMVLITNKTVAAIILILTTELIIWTSICVRFLRYRNEWAKWVTFQHIKPPFFRYAPTIARLTMDLGDFPLTNHEERLLIFLGSVWYILTSCHQFKWLSR